MGDCLVSGPRLLTSLHIVLLAMALLKWLPGQRLASRAGSVGGLTPPGHEPSAGLFVAHTLHPILLFCHLPEMTPSSASAQHPSPTAGSTPLNLPSSQGLSLPFSSEIGMEPGHPDFPMGDDPLCFSRAPETPLGATWIVLVTGMMNSNSISTNPPKMGVPLHLT